MKRFFLILALVGSALGQAHYSAAGSGDWKTAGTWTVVSGTPSCSVHYPCGPGDTNYVSGGGDIIDTINTGDVVVCSNGETCYIGTSPANTTTSVLNLTGGTLQVGDSNGGATLVVRGGVCDVSNCGVTTTAQTGLFDFYDNSNIYFDSSYSGVSGGEGYIWALRTSASGSPPTVNVRGTCPSRDASGNCTGGVNIWSNSFGQLWASTTSCTGSSNCCVDAVHCNAATFGYDGTHSFNTIDSGLVAGTQGISYLHIHGLAGITNASQLTATITTAQSKATNITGLTFDTAGQYTVVVAASATAGAAWSCDGCQITNTTNTGGQFGFSFTGCSSSCGSVVSGAFIIRNSHMASGLAVPTVADKTTRTYNTLFETSLAGAYANTQPAYSSANDSGIHDSLMFFNNSSNTGSSGNASRKINLPIYNLTRSITWGELDGTGSTQPQNAGAGLTNGPGDGTTAHITGNWGATMAALDINAESSAQSGINGTAPGTAMPVIVSGNISGCGFDGRASQNAFLGEATLAVSNASFTYTQNSNCADRWTTVGGKNRGTYGTELSGNQPVDFVTSVNSGIFGTNAASAPFVPIACASGFAGQTNIYIQEVANNSIINSNVSSVPCCSGVNGVNWTVNNTCTGDTNTTYLSGTMNAYLAQPWRSWPIFDTLYLIPSGIMPGSTRGESAYTYWSGKTGFQGAWVSGHSYNVGDIVGVSSNSSSNVYVSSAPTIYQGTEVYMRCRTAHTSSSNNAPVFGQDATNPYQNGTLFWEEADMQQIRSWVLQGTQFWDGSLGVSSNYSHTHVQDATDCGIVCLANAWLINGWNTVQGQFWGAGKSGVDRGNQAQPIQHKPPVGNAT